MAAFEGHESYGSFKGVMGTNEVQLVEHDATDGTLTLSFEEDETAAIAYNAAAATVQAALEDLETIGEGNVEVEGEAGGPWTVTFVGALRWAPQELLVADGDGLTAEEGVTVTRVTAGVASPAAAADRPDYDPSEFANQPGAAARDRGYPRSDGRPFSG